MKKIEFLFKGNFDVEGQPRHFEKGQVETVPDDDAARLIKGKCAVDVMKKTAKPKEVKYDRKNGKQMG